jgi:serine/threonine protein kinase
LNIARGLAFLHSKGIVHRSVRENVTRRASVREHVTGLRRAPAAAPCATNFLNCAHSLSRVRDLKPGNVMMSQEGKPKVRGECVVNAFVA